MPDRVMFAYVLIAIVVVGVSWALVAYRNQRKNRRSSRRKKSRRS